MQIDTTYNFQKDTQPLDADRYSPILQEYHRILWNKPLPNGEIFTLTKISRNRLYHKSYLGEFYLSSDRAIPTYFKYQNTKDVISQIPKDKLNKFINLTETIGAITIWPSNKVDRKPTINGAKGFEKKISDRLDLTIECIRRYYLGEDSPLFDTLKKYDNFFKLFNNFQGYIDFFLFNNYLNADYSVVKIAPPFDNFNSIPIPTTPEEYLSYMEHATNLVVARNQLIAKRVKQGMYYG